MKPPCACGRDPVKTGGMSDLPQPSCTLPTQAVGARGFQWVSHHPWILSATPGSLPSPVPYPGSVQGLPVARYRTDHGSPVVIQATHPLHSMLLGTQSLEVGTLLRSGCPRKVTSLEVPHLVCSRYAGDHSSYTLLPLFPPALTDSGKFSSDSSIELPGRWW